MTSEENNKETINFLEENKYFGYPKEDVCFFKQGELPLINQEGKLLIDEDGLIKEASNGNGGIFDSMIKKSVLKDIDKREIEWVFISGVDNILANLVDPLLIGMSVYNNVLAAVKSVEKNDPEENVGVFCKINEKIGIIEYTEISKEMANQRDESNSLVYGDLNPVLHLYNIKALKKAINLKLPYHVAFKKAKYVDENGKLIVPDKPNVYKFEMFIFDSFKILEDVLILRVKREDEFAPIKNMTGKDSPQTAKKLYENYWKNRENMI